MVTVRVMVALALGVLVMGWYLRKRRSAPTTGETLGRTDGSVSALGALDATDYEWSVTFRCPWCEAENDPQFAFCRECAGKLSP